MLLFPVALSAKGQDKLLYVQLFPLPDPSVYGNVPTPTPGSAQEQIAELVWGIIQNARYILGTVAIVFIVYAGVRMVLGWGSDEVYSTQKNTILYGIIGLAAVGLAGEVANIFSVTCPDFTAPWQTNLQCTPGGFLKDPAALIRTNALFSEQTKTIVVFIKYFIGSIAVLMIVKSGMRMVTMGASEDKLEIDKKNLFYSILGLGLIIIADTAISQVFYRLDFATNQSTNPSVDAARAVKEIVGFTNLIVSIVGPVAVLALLAGGAIYMTSAGNEDKMKQAKRLIMAALAGIILMYGAFAIVSTFIAGQF